MKKIILPSVQLFFSAILMWIVSIYGFTFDLINLKYNNEYALSCLIAGVVINRA